MRKFAAAFLLLAALSAGVLGWAAVRMTDGLYRVEVPCRTLLGDPSAAAGLEADVSLEVDWRLLWHTVLTAQGAPETAFRFVRAGEAPDPFASQPSLDIGPYSTGGFGSEAGLPLDGSVPWVTQQLGGMEALYAEIAARTPAGTSHSETVRLAEALPYYPLEISLQLGENFWEGYYVADAPGQDLRGLLAGRLQIPADGADCPELTVTKDAAGRVTAISLSENGAPVLETASAILPPDARQRGVCLFAFAGGWAAAHPPGLGWGVYGLPYGAGEDTPDFAVYPRQLSLVLPLEAGERVLAMAPAAEGDAALLVSEDAAGCFLTVLDAGGERPQRLTLPLTPPRETDGGRPACTVTAGSGFAVIGAGDRLAVVTCGSGVWQLAFCAGTDAAQRAVARQGWTWAASDGPGFAWDSRGVMLAVWDAGGLGWLGTYDIGLACNRGSQSPVCTAQRAPALCWRPAG